MTVFRHGNGDQHHDKKKYSARMVSSSKKSKPGTNRQTQTALLHLSKEMKKHEQAQLHFQSTGTFYFHATCAACKTSASVTKHDRD